MPDVTGGPPPHQQLGAGGVAGPPAPAVSAAQLSAGHVGKAPDILRTEQLPPVSPASAACPPAVPSSDRNLFMETGELAEEDVARCAEAAARAQGLALSPAQLRSVLDMQQVSRVGGTSLARTGCKQIASRIDIVVGPRRGDL